MLMGAGFTGFQVLEFSVVRVDFPLNGCEIQRFKIKRDVASIGALGELFALGTTENSSRQEMTL
jgi:hypothetical protein